jgi:hypothetical protein
LAGVWDSEKWPTARALSPLFPAFLAVCVRSHSGACA